jgi:hypothetical protein
MIDRIVSNKQPPTLEQRIVAALGNPNNGSDTLIELIRETEIAATTADQAAIDEHAKALDLEASPDATSAHQRVIAAEMTRDRLQTNLPKLRENLTSALTMEARERWLSDYRRVSQMRDEAVTQFLEYRQHAQAIAQMFALAEQVDREVSRINGNAPDNVHQRLSSVELTARNMTQFSRDNPALASTVELRDWENSGRKLWPTTSSGSFAAMAVAGMTVPHPSADWSTDEVREQRKAEGEKQHREMASYYQQATKDEEDRKNREERERFAQAHKRV